MKTIATSIQNNKQSFFITVVKTAVDRSKRVEQIVFIGLEIDL